MFMVVGLGNPDEGRERVYRDTRHNLGFRVADLLIERFGEGSPKIVRKFDSELSKALYHEHETLVQKPMTYMNLSGSAVVDAVRFYKIDWERRLLVVHDDLDLPLGRLRLRHGGSAGGHRGVQSVIERLGSKEFMRLRIGIGRPTKKIPIENYVVSRFTKKEEELVGPAVERAADAVEMLILEGDVKAMNIYNQ